MSDTSNVKITPSLTDEEQEKKLIALTLSVVEKDLSEGTASSQVKTHFLELSRQKADIQLEQMRLQNELLEAKISEAKSNARIEQALDEVKEALRSYIPDRDILL